MSQYVLQNGLPQDSFEKVFTMCDLDKDGFLDLSEFSSAAHLFHLVQTVGDRVHVFLSGGPSSAESSFFVNRFIDNARNLTGRHVPGLWSVVSHPDRCLFLSPGRCVGPLSSSVISESGLDPHTQDG